MFREEKGISLILLVITVIVMVIIGGAVVGSGITEIRNTKNNKLLSELEIVQQAVLQAYTNYKKTNEETFLVGTNVTQTELNSLSSELGINFVTIPEEFYDEGGNLKTIAQYYRLSSSLLEDIGIYESKDVYIVNYLTGEVINETVKKTFDDKPLYIYSVNEFNTNDVTSF